MIQPRAASTGGTKREDLVDGIASDILQQLPDPWILEDVMKAKADDASPLHVVLFQEVERCVKENESPCAHTHARTHARTHTHTHACTNARTLSLPSPPFPSLSLFCIC